MVLHQILKSLLCGKKQTNTIKRLKRQAIGKDKIFAKLVSDKGWISKIYKEPLKFNSKETMQFKSGQKILRDTSQKRHMDGK